MFATPAHTAEGRRAKVTVLLLVMGDDWRHADEATEHQELMARNLLIEFIGGEPGGDARSVRIGNYLCAGDRSFTYCDPVHSARYRIKHPYLTNVAGRIQLAETLSYFGDDGSVSTTIALRG